LADLKPDEKAIADFKKIFGDDDSVECAGRVTKVWREKHVLVQAKINVSSGKIADMASAALLDDLTARLQPELTARKHKRLDAARIRSQDRGLTRAASRLLYSDGHAGIVFRSRLDDIPCHALFEGRARLDQLGSSIPLSGKVTELASVCMEYGLTLQ
jgi:hypothetical protein